MLRRAAWRSLASAPALRRAAPPLHAASIRAHGTYESAGSFGERDPAFQRDLGERAFTVGIGGPVGSGKTALMLALCQELRSSTSLCAVTNDIFTREDAEFLTRHGALAAERIRAVETGGCPHAAIREDVTANLMAAEELTREFAPDLVLMESGGDNLAANFSRELADFIVYVIDVAGGDKVPRKGGPGVTQSDVLVVNKTDLAELIGADLGVMASDAARMRGDGPTLFTQVKNGVGVAQLAEMILDAKGRMAAGEGAAWTSDRDAHGESGDDGHGHSHDCGHGHSH